MTFTKSIQGMTGTELMQLLGNPANNERVAFKVDLPYHHKSWIAWQHQGRGIHRNTTYVHLLRDGHIHLRGPESNTIFDFALV